MYEYADFEDCTIDTIDHGSLFEDDVAEEAWSWATSADDFDLP
jgi:hypothetical protein